MLLHGVAEPWRCCVLLHGVVERMYVAGTWSCIHCEQFARASETISDLQRKLSRSGDKAASSAAAASKAEKRSGGGGVDAQQLELYKKIVRCSVCHVSCCSQTQCVRAFGQLGADCGIFNYHPSSPLLELLQFVSDPCILLTTGQQEGCGDHEVLPCILSRVH